MWSESFLFMWKFTATSSCFLLLCLMCHHWSLQVFVLSSGRKHKPWTTLWQHVYTELLLHSTSFLTWLLSPLGVKHIIGVITDIRQGECHLGRWTGPVVQIRKPSSLFAKASFYSTCLTPDDWRGSSWNKADAVAMGYWRAAVKERYFMSLA